VPVTERDRVAVTAASERGRLTLGAGQRSADGPAGIADEQRTSMEAMFAATKPPFEAGAIFVTSDAHVYVKRLRAASSDEVLYDRFNERGVRIDRFLLPPKSKIVGANGSALFVVTLDEDDLPRLAKYVL
jgi:hypothetical protein